MHKGSRGSPVRKAAYAVTAAVVLLMLTPACGEAGWMAKRTRATVAVTTEPAARMSSDTLLRSMLTAADEWWAAQGTPPPCAGHATVEWGNVEDFTGYAMTGACKITLSPRWWSVQYRFLTRRGRLRARRRAAAYDLALVIHERGHTLGYGHRPGTVMQEGTPVVPELCFAWAARTIH